MSPIFSMLLLPFLCAMFLAVNMGGSGTAPSFSASYGADLIRKDKIPGLFGIAVFFGALLAGKKVSLTIGKGILPGEVMGITLTAIILLSVALSLLMANLMKIPQSTSQSTIFALIGPAVYFDILKTDKLVFEIIPAWFILPVISFVITYVIGKFIYGPLKRNSLINFNQIALHPGLKFLVILASLYVAFAIGSNNVANAAGPIASMISNELHVAPNDANFLLIMLISTLIIAPCFGIGSSIFGHRVVETTGKEIVGFGPLGATLVSCITATLLLLASVTRGIPTSLVQMNTAAIIALGITKTGWKNTIRQTSVKKMLTIWIIAPLIALIISFVLTILADKFGLLNR
ncbi:MAG: inorganic phosphate transporter [Candidatus Latescibacteria bacterium]|nr:inorganic phosphate transporter [Candidatus Latescibacterota bacterium]